MLRVTMDGEPSSRGDVYEPLEDAKSGTRSAERLVEVVRIN